MCLTVNLKFLEPKVAEENMPCYKKIRNTGQADNHNEFYYTKGVVNDEEGAVQKQLDEIKEWQDTRKEGGKPPLEVYHFEEGFHSRIPSRVHEYQKTHLFIIPKGTLYVEGGENNLPFNATWNNNYISEKIIYVGKNNFLNRFLASWKYGVTFK